MCLDTVVFVWDTLLSGAAWHLSAVHTAVFHDAADKQELGEDGLYLMLQKVKMWDCPGLGPP